MEYQKVLQIEKYRKLKDNIRPNFGDLESRIKAKLLEITNNDRFLKQKIIGGSAIADIPSPNVMVYIV